MGLANAEPMSTPSPVPGNVQASRAAAVWRDRLSLLLESTGEGVYGIDMEGLCTFINRAGAQMLGHEPEAVLGLNMHELMHHTDADGGHYPVDHCPIYQAFRAGVPCRIDSEVLWRRDGSAFAAEYSSYPILDGGQVLGAVVTFVDISERREQAARLKQAHDDLEQRVAERTQALSQALSQLRELQAHIDGVREAERKRIAREIHDELGSLLVGLKMDVSWLEKRVADQPALHCKCRDMRGLIDGAVDKVGRIITDLRPSILDHQGLWPTLEWQAQDFMDSSELRCHWTMDIAAGLAEPEGPMATAVFRIFQEMLSNVARHAQATEVEIRLCARPSDLTLRVKDNGRGAPPSVFNSPHAYGVMGMRERAGHFGGWLHIDSQMGQGTQIILSMPLYQPASAQAARQERAA
ncbi:MAG: PAS domain-containing sensor histidine kinase [Rubrivivax sp.]|nr:MAG: PAS domain-containing sensor histidine kinase [Rubrivivax sp.]